MLPPCSEQKYQTSHILLHSAEALTEALGMKQATTMHCNESIGICETDTTLAMEEYLFTKHLFNPFPSLK